MGSGRDMTESALAMFFRRYADQQLLPSPYSQRWLASTAVDIVGLDLAVTDVPPSAITVGRSWPMRAS